MKEIRLRLPNTETDDYPLKIVQAIRFLVNGEALKLTVMFRGREIAHPDLGKRLLLRFEQDLEKYGKAEEPLVLDGKKMFQVFAPKGVKV